MHDAADKLALALLIGGAILAFLMLTIGYRYNMARRRRSHGRAADFGGVFVGHSPVASGRRHAADPHPHRPKRAGHRAGASDTAVSPTYVFVGDGGGGAHCSSDGGGGGCDGGGGS